MTNPKRISPRKLGKMHEQMIMETDPTFVNRVRERFIYDPETGDFRYRKNYQSMKAGDLAGTTQSKGRLQITFENRAYLVHRLIWLIQTGVWPAAEIDHIDRAATGHHANRWSNLREATRVQNMANRDPSIVNNTGYRGVVASTKQGRYRAFITHRGHTMYLGTFDGAATAARAYDAKARELNGEYAVTNFPTANENAAPKDASHA